MSGFDDLDYNKPMSLKTWGRMLPFILPQKKTLVLCALLMLLNALIDVFFPLILGLAIRNNIEPRTTDGMWRLMAISLAMITVQAVSVRFFIDWGIRAESAISRAIRNAVFLHLQKLGLSYYSKTPVGFMMARTTSDTSRIGDIVAWGIIDFSWAVFYCVGVVIAMFVIHWRMALIVCVTIPPLALLTWFFQKRIFGVNRTLQKLNSKITGAMNEGITGARTVKVLVAERQSLAEYSGITGEYRRNAKRMARLRSIFIPTLLFVGTAATAALLGYGGWEIAVMGANLAVLAIFLQYAGGFFDPIQNIAHVLTEFVATQANIERVSGLLDHAPDVTDNPDIVEKYGDAFSPKKENWEVLKGDVEFRDVTFRYPGANKDVLENFSLQVAAGTCVAIVGETGAGKSTIVNLICRFFEPTDGVILIDGKDSRERSQLWLHSNMGYVLQSSHLFTGTIRDNIRYGRLSASDAEVEAAAGIVHADKIIAKMEKDFDTDVGEGGDRLSTGEKQLIAFARAVLADPRIFILDEATSSVDTEMEMLLQEAIQTLLKGRTSFVIAHRLSTIRNADIILVVDEGKIIERGTHDELMGQQGHYRKLYTSQFEEEAEKRVLRG